MGAPFLWIAAGGAIGACARHGMSLVAQKTFGTAFPWGTLLVNVIGCFLFGIVAGLAATRGAFGPAGRVFLMVGVLGGFTTYSSFAFETVNLLRNGQPAAAALNVGGQILAGTLAVWIGLLLAR